jgi:hypothetical protein
MKIWLGLLVAPLLVLSDQVIAYATVGWACNHASPMAVHAVHALFLAGACAATVVAWQQWQAARPDRSHGEAIARANFLAGLALVSAALCVLLIVALWTPTWILAPCAN